MHDNSTRFVRMALGLVAAVGITGGASADPFTGPISPYYLNNHNEGTTYVVQGTSVINSFPLIYNGNVFDCPLCEANLAISNGHVNTNWFGNVTDFGPGYGGQYTLSGTPTGVYWPDSSPPPGTLREFFSDGTSDGVHNYTVEFSAFPGETNVVASDLQWQNPTALFTVPGSNVGITYDAVENALWIVQYNDGAMSEYSLTGALLTSFNTGLFQNSALAYDPADNTLWLTYSDSNFLAQYSKTGVQLQFGAVTDLPSCCYLAAEIAGEFVPPPTVPEPASLALVGTGLAGLWFTARRRNRLSAEAGQSA